MRIILLSLWRNKFTSVINIICLTLGMLIATIFICQANGAIDAYNKNIRYINLNEVFIMAPFYYDKDKRIQFSELENIKIQLNFVEDVFILNRLPEDNLQSNGKYITGIGVYMVSENFNSCFNSGYLLKGGWIKDTRDCVIGKKVVQKYRLSIGDTIDIGINRYNVSGITDIPKYNSAIFINEKSITDLKVFDCLYYVKVNLVSEENKDLLHKFVLKNYGNYKIKDKKKVITEEKRRLYSGWGPSMLIAVIAFIYGILNIRNIEMFYIEQEKRTIAVMRAYGGTQSQIFVQKIIKASILSFIASILVYIIVYMLQFTKLNLVFDLKVDIKAYGILLIMGQLISIIFSYFMSRKLLTKEIAEILRENV